MHTVPVHVIRHYYLSQVQTNRSTDSYSCQNYLFPFPLIVLGQQLAIPVPLEYIFPQISGFTSRDPSSRNIFRRSGNQLLWIRLHGTRTKIPLFCIRILSSKTKPRRLKMDWLRNIFRNDFERKLNYTISYSICSPILISRKHIFVN